MHDILISTPVFDNTKTLQYHLSIQSDLDGFSFSICDSLSNKFIYLAHKPHNQSLSLVKNTEFFLENEPLFKLPFKTVKVLFNLSPSTNVPTAVFDESNVADYYSLNYKLADKTQLLFDAIQSIEMVNIYAISDAIKIQFDSYFPEYEIRHINTLKHWLANSYKRKKGSSHIFLTVNKASFTISVFNGELLLLQNNFTYQNDEEFLYFFLYCFNQLNLDQHNTVVELEGIFPKQATFIKKLQQFIQYIELASWPETLNFTDDFYEFPSHYFHNLYYLHLCE